MRASRGLAFAGAGLAAALFTCIAWMPVGVADWGLERLSSGRLRLADASGTIWNGQGRLVLPDMALLAESAAQGGPLQGLVLPGRLGWRLQALPLLLGMVDATVTLDGLSAPVRLSGSGVELTLSGARLEIPTLDLGRLGSPWNTIRPSASVGLSWDGLTIRQGVFDGRMSVELREVASVMSPVRPLGSYRIDVTSSGPQTDLSLSTLAGPLRLSGKGQWSGGAGMRFTAEASADERERANLQGMLGLIGRREGDRVIIKIGA